jgi:hypothetical protein
VEPGDLTDPVAHQVATSAEGVNRTRVLAASRRGLGHAHDGKYREDSFAICCEGAWLLAAVADGTGSKPLARVGARLAADAGISYLGQNIDRGVATQDVSQCLRGALAGAMVHALARINDEAVCRRRDPDDFATTLILVAYLYRSGKQWIGLAQIGDGALALQLADGTSSFLGQADRGLFAGESLFLTSREAQLSWPKRVHVFEISQPIRLLVAGTDGVMDDFTPPLGELTSLFASVGPLAELGNAEGLQQWLGYERRGSFDDRTAVVIAPGNRNAEPAQ